MKIGSLLRKPFELYKYFKDILKLAHKNFLCQLISGMIIGVFGSFAEAGLSFMLTAILVVLGILTPENLPDFLKTYKLSRVNIILLTCVCIFVRAMVLFGRHMIYGRIFHDFKRINEQRLVTAAITDESLSPYSGAYVTATIANVLPRGGNVMRNISDFCVYFFIILPIIIFLFKLNLLLTLLAFLGFGFVGFIGLHINKRILKIGTKLQPIFRRFTETYLRSMRNRTLLRIYGTVGQEAAETVILSRKYRRTSVQSLNYQAGAALLGNLFSPLWLIGILFVGSYHLTIPAAMLLSFFYLFMRIAVYFSNLSTAVSAIVSDMPAIQEMLESPWISQEMPKIIEVSPTTRYHALDSTGKNAIKPVKIEVRDLSFYYHDKAIFQNLNFSVAEGKCLAVIGPSGSGKSTLIGIIAGLLTPGNGTVLIDNIAPGHNDFFSFRRNIGYVGSEPLLKEGTIYENLIYGLHEEIDRKKIFEVLERVQLKDLFLQDNNCLERKIYEEGAGISSGQKQRICLARALLRDPRLLILDEATANLDEKTEKSIIDYLKQLKGIVTMVICSHRPQPLVLADQIIDLGGLARKKGHRDASFIGK